MPSKLNHGIPSRAGRPRSGAKRLAPRETLGARAPCPRNRTTGIPSRAGRPRSGGNASLRGKRLERGHLALETEPRDSVEGGAPSLRGKTPRSEGDARSEGTLPSKPNHGIPSRAGRPRSGAKRLAPGGNARSEGTLPSKPNHGIPSRAGRPRSKPPGRGHLALETEPRESRRGRGALAPGQSASLRGLLQPLQRLEAQLAPPVALAAVGLAQARIERRLRVNDAVVRLQGGVA